MTTPDIQQALGWADDMRRVESACGGVRQDALAAAELIQSLPDAVVDGDKLREVIADWGDREVTSDAYTLYRKVLELIPAPQPRTLADMTPEERAVQKWSQVKISPTASTTGIITAVDEYSRSAIILFADGMAKNVPWDRITPLPGPRLEWPSLSLSGESEAVSVETEDVTEESEPTLPRPEDVPVGEAWLVLGEGRRAIGYRNDPGDRIPWCITYQGCMEFDYCYDSDVTLVSRLVPEVKP